MGNASHRMPSSLRGAAVLPPVPDQSPHEGSQPSLVDVEGFQPSLMDVNATGEVLLEGQVGAAPCLNHNWDCIKWSNQGGCTTNPVYMMIPATRPARVASRRRRIAMTTAGTASPWPSRGSAPATLSSWGRRAGRLACCASLKP